MKLKEELQRLIDDYFFWKGNSTFIKREHYKQVIIKTLEELNNRIPRKDIEDLKEKIHWELDKNGITRGYQIIIDGYFNKLLNKE